MLPDLNCAEGGKFRGSDRKRAALLIESVRNGARYVDLEADAPKAVRDALDDHVPRPAIIASRHIWYGQRINPERDFRRLKPTGADILKLAFLASDPADICYVLRFLGLARRARVRAIAIAMEGGWYSQPHSLQEAGSVGDLRVCRVGSRIGPRSAYPGRITDGVGDPGMIDGASRVFGILGRPVSHSLSPAMHNAAFAALQGTVKMRIKPWKNKKSKTLAIILF